MVDCFVVIVSVRHEKLTDPYSEAAQTAHDEQQNQPRSSIWKDVSLGWIPDPKGDYTRFSNSLLAEFSLKNSGKDV